MLHHKENNYVLLDFSYRKGQFLIIEDIQFSMHTY